MKNLLAELTFSQMECEELKLRLAELRIKDKYPSSAFHLEKEKPNNYGIVNYKIVDEKGFENHRFLSQNDEAAKTVFKNFKNKYIPTKRFVIKSEHKKDFYTSLIYFEIFRLDSDNKVFIHKGYSIYVGEKSIRYINIDYEYVTEEEVIEIYEKEIDNYLNNLIPTKAIVLI